MQQRLQKVRVAPILISLAMLFGVTQSVYIVTSHSTIANIQAVRDAVAEMKKRTAEGELVFNASWAGYPLLSYLNTHNNYAYGMANTFTELHDKESYTAWQHFIKDPVQCSDCTDIHVLFEQATTAHLIYLNETYPHDRNVLEKMASSSHFERVYKSHTAPHVYLYALQKTSSTSPTTTLPNAQKLR
jgi:hypothetical protein